MPWNVCSRKRPAGVIGEIRHTTPPFVRRKVMGDLRAGRLYYGGWNGPARARRLSRRRMHSGSRLPREPFF